MTPLPDNRETATKVDRLGIVAVVDERSRPQKIARVGTLSIKGEVKYPIRLVLVSCAGCAIPAS